MAPGDSTGQNKVEKLTKNKLLLKTRAWKCTNTCEFTTGQVVELSAPCMLLDFGRGNGSTGKTLTNKRCDRD